MGGQNSPRTWIWGCVATLLFSALCYFTPPSVLESSDYVAFYGPNLQFLLDALNERRMPLWNPYIGLGRPYLADVQNAVLYPPVYAILAGKELGVFLLISMHCALCLYGMLRLGDAFRMKRAIAVVVAFTFLASGGVSGRLFAGQLFYWAAMCYVPLLFWFAARMGERWQPGLLGLYALTLALQFLCGHPQVFWFCALGQALFIVARTVPAPSRQWRSLFHSMAQYFAVMLWCFGITAAVLLPFLELVQEGNRQLPSREFVSFGKFVWPQLLSLAHPMRGSLALDWERILFIGGPMFLAGLAGCASLPNRNVRALLVMALGTMLMGMADSTPLFSFFYHVLPGYSSFRLHARFGLLAAFALLCAGGCWLSSPNPLGWLPNWFRSRTRLAFGLFMGLQLLHLAYGTLLMKSGYAVPEAAQALPPPPSIESRIITTLRARGLLTRGAPPPRISVPRSLLTPNAAMVHHYSHFDAYTSLFLRRPWLFIHLMAGFPPPELKNTFIDRRIYGRGPFPVPNASLQAGVSVDGQEIVYATNIEPRAFIAFNTEVAADFTNALGKIKNQHNIYRRPIVEMRAYQIEQADGLEPLLPQIDDFQPNHVHLSFEAKQKGLLVLAEAYYPGWKLETGGAVRDALPVNAWMRGFTVEAGRHSVKIVFRQNYLTAGLVLSTISIAAIVLAGFVNKQRTQK